MRLPIRRPWVWAANHRRSNKQPRLYSRASSGYATPTSTKPLPLKGLRVLDLSRVLAGPYCTQILSDYGAEIIKVEQPGVGDETRQWRAAGESAVWKDGQEGMSLYFSSINRNKRSVTLNLKSEKGQEVAKNLAAECDILIHNFIPGSAERMGLGYDALSKINDRLIYASISGYGSHGPSQKRAGYDGIVLGETGILHITGEANGGPAKPGVAILDMCTGLYTHGAILAAIQQRHQTGKGLKIEGSLFETGMSLLINVGLNALNLDRDDPSRRRRGQRFGTEHPSLAPYGAFRTKDGKYIMIAGNNNRQFATLCERIDLGHLASDPRFQTNDGRLRDRDEINGIIQDRLLEKTRDEWMEVLEGSGLPYGGINDVVESVEHPQAAATGMLMDVDGVQAAKNGTLKMIGPPMKFENTPIGLRTNPPLLGEHTEEVLQELGYTTAAIKDMQDSGVV